MLTATITNLSTTDIIEDGALPPPFQLVGDIAASGNVDAVCTVSDLDKVINQHTGFTSADMLQQLVQIGTLTVAFADIGATDVGVYDDAVATAS